MVFRSINNKHVNAQEDDTLDLFRGRATSSGNNVYDSTDSSSSQRGAIRTRDEERFRQVSDAIA